MTAVSEVCALLKENSIVENGRLVISYSQFAKSRWRCQEKYGDLYDMCFWPRVYVSFPFIDVRGSPFVETRCLVKYIHEFERRLQLVCIWGIGGMCVWCLTFIQSKELHALSDQGVSGHTICWNSQTENSDPSMRWRLETGHISQLHADWHALKSSSIMKEMATAKCFSLIWRRF